MHAPLQSSNVVGRITAAVQNSSRVTIPQSKRGNESFDWTGYLSCRFRKNLRRSEFAFESYAGHRIERYRRVDCDCGPFRYQSAGRSGLPCRFRFASADFIESEFHFKWGRPWNSFCRRSAGDDSVAGNRHPGQVGYSYSPPQEVRDEEPSLRADLGKEGEG
jgi:hypothetical protein